MEVTKSILLTSKKQDLKIDHLKIQHVSNEVIQKNKELKGEHICKYFFIQESAELIKELTKSMVDEENKEELIQEIADVYYTLSMLVQEYGVTELEINNIIKFKENRAKKKLGLL